MNEYNSTFNMDLSIPEVAQNNPRHPSWYDSLSSRRLTIACPPRSKVKIMAIGAACFFLSMPMATYCLVFTSNISPALISKKWFIELPIGEQIFSVINTVIYLGVNTLFFSSLLLTATDKFRAVSCNTYSLLTNTTALMLGLSSALSAASLAYDGFSWGGTIVSAVASMCNFIAFGGTRYVGALKVIELLRNGYDDDVRFQKSLIDKLRLLKTEFKPEANAFLQTKTIDELTIKDLLIQLHAQTRLDSLTRVSLFHTKTQWEYAKEYGGMALDVTAGAIMIYYVFLYSSQKGYSGVNIFCQLLSNKATALDGLSNPQKIAIGFFPGASSSLFMFFPAFNLRTQCLKLFDSLKNNLKKNLAILSLIIVAVGLAATAVYNSAQAMVCTDNIFSISKESSIGKTLAIINCLGLGIAYFNFVSLQVFPYKSTLITNPIIEDVITWLENNTLTTITIENLKSHLLLAQHSFDTEHLLLEQEEKTIEIITTAPILNEHNLSNAAIANASILTGLGSMTTQFSAQRDTAPNSVTTHRPLANCTF